MFYLVFYTGHICFNPFMPGDLFDKQSWYFWKYFGIKHEVMNFLKECNSLVMINVLIYLTGYDYYLQIFCQNDGGTLKQIFQSQWPFS